MNITMCSECGNALHDHCFDCSYRATQGLDLSLEELCVVGEIAYKKGLTPAQLFKQALRCYQLWDGQPDRPDVRALEAATMNVCHRLEWAIQFIGALVPTKDGFKLDYEKANWDNADEWMPIAKRELTACIAALATIRGGKQEGQL